MYYSMHVMSFLADIKATLILFSSALFFSSAKTIQVTLQRVTYAKVLLHLPRVYNISYLSVGVKDGGAGLCRSDTGVNQESVKVCIHYLPIITEGFVPFAPLQV